MPLLPVEHRGFVVKGLRFVSGHLKFPSSMAPQDRKAGGSKIPVVHVPACLSPDVNL